MAGFIKLEIMENPFSLNYTDQEDKELVKLSIEGNKKALQSLIVRHQIFVYNLALKMSRNTEDAEDLTQEVFIKAITYLAKFEGKSNFQTWLYRIAVNHFINTRKRKSELSVVDFESYFSSIDNIPDQDLSDQEKSELKTTIEEIRINCTNGMLLCLSREQRMVYILGEMFEIEHNLGSEIMGISQGNFRIKLMRARKDLYHWMNKKCGLVNSNNPCRCAKKTKSYIKAGKVNSTDLQFNKRYQERIMALSKKKAVHITNAIDDLNKRVFQTHPLQKPARASKIIEEIFNHDLIKEIIKV